jgi:hypothetical protein
MNTWDAALELAMLYGWQPALGGSAHYHRGAHVTQADARALADALVWALLDLADEPPKAVDKRLDSPREPPAWYFGGQAGKQKVLDLIAFCRQGAFRIESS